MDAWRSQQTTTSWTVFLVGAGALALVVLGSAFLLLAGGITPYENLLDTMRSDAQKVVLYLAVSLGLGASVAGFVLFRRMPTKHSREAAVSGAALGVQAVLFAALYLIFSSGAKFDIFVRQYLSFDIIP